MTTNPAQAEKLLHLSSKVHEAETALTKARQGRDQLIREQVKLGELTMYAISKMIGISPNGVRKIVNK